MKFFLAESQDLVDKALRTGKDPTTNTKIENPSKTKSLVENKYLLSRYTLRTEEKTAASSVVTFGVIMLWLILILIHT